MGIVRICGRSGSHIPFVDTQHVDIGDEILVPRAPFAGQFEKEVIEIWNRMYAVSTMNGDLTHEF
jgi:hypothetical protein